MNDNARTPRAPANQPAGLGDLPTSSLLVRINDGDDAAREELVRRYWPRLARWARGRLPTGERGLYETGDLVQEALVATLGRLRHFRPEHDGSLITYFRTVILNRIRTLARRRRARGESVELSIDVADGGPSPLDHAIGRETVERYERALARLTPGERAAIQLRVELDLPYEEIALELGKPTVTAARMALSRALCRLAREMQRDS